MKSPGQNSGSEKVRTSSQDELVFRPASRSREVILREVKGPINPSAHYEGDLALTYALSERPPLTFTNLPLNLCYVQILRAFGAAADLVLKEDEPHTAAEKLVNLFREYFGLGIKLHMHAAKTVCSDSSRFTTALGFANSCLFSLLRISQIILEGNGSSVIEIDVGIAGMRAWDGGALSVPYQFSAQYSGMLRPDPSRGKAYLASHPDVFKADLRETSFISLLRGDTGGGMPCQAIPSAVYTPLADAFRGMPDSIRREVVRAADAFRANVRQGAERLSDEDIED